VRRVVLCSGKVTYDLLAARAATQREDVAIVRIEQLYPLPLAEVREALAAFPADVEVVWTQEEPANQGAWPFIALNLAPELGRAMQVVAREPMSAPACGTHSQHEREQKDLVARALA
jgi:2-oxoglutarate dehydrogenase complex dehydrogenase (E1) component-like enzyme